MLTIVRHKVVGAGLFPVGSLDTALRVRLGPLLADGHTVHLLLHSAIVAPARALPLVPALSVLVVFHPETEPPISLYIGMPEVGAASRA